MKEVRIVFQLFKVYGCTVIFSTNVSIGNTFWSFCFFFLFFFEEKIANKTEIKQSYCLLKFTHLRKSIDQSSDLLIKAN